MKIKGFLKVLVLFGLLLARAAAEIRTSTASPSVSRSTAAVVPSTVASNTQINDALSSSLRDVNIQLEKFNSLYLGKLESKILAIATLMGHIDSNVKHLQERAHVWDTFQLHVSAWNEQIKALDRKVDFISRGQERFEVFDAKMNQMLGAQEEQLQRVSGRLDEIDSRLGGIAKNIDDNAAGANNEPSTPLLGEFATRGVLSTLKGIERKVDKLIAQAKADEKSHATAEKAASKCQAPSSVLEALLQDVASKVDVIFDRLPEEGEVEIRGMDSRAWRRMASPLRRTWRALESVEKAVKSSEETTAQLKRGQEHLLKLANHTLRHSVQGSECCRKHRDENQNLTVRATNSCISAVSESTELTLRNMRDLLTNTSHEIEHLEDLILDHIAYNNTCPFENNSMSNEDESDLMSPSLLDSDYEDVSTKTPHHSSSGKSKKFHQWSCSDINGNSGITSLLGEDVAVGHKVEANGAQNWLYCDQDTDGGGWTVVQRRGHYGKLENFTRPWEDYKIGFGDLRKEFWAGNDFLHHATSGERPVKLRIELRDFEGNFTYAEYSLFRVGSEKTNFRLTVAGYSGNASDSFSSHNGTPFSTIDKTNDESPACCPCAKTYASGWWFHSCFEANLNGEYFMDPEGNNDFQGIIWEKWRDDYSLAHTEMKIRPLDFEGGST
ncbi:angiopoietin-2-like [Neocloeon triangulifer]|uniref:angiopoietin-2-like n=1 Tax=Neocloeon triangulifer TaxID=2078957 RepID=UPI00286F0C3F|nr:angiopoietin-2-like [Neocloeon triangulifer]